MISSKSVANAVGGKTARACDSCVKKRAKWYCAADDAFLCQSCDSNIHSANPLARRHDRVQLKIGSLKALQVEPSWHRGFKRKARTPRPGKPNPLSKSLSTLIPFVPELGSDEVSVEDNEEEQQLLYRVPNFDPFAADEFCASNGPRFVGNTVESLQGFSPSEMDLAEFAADVESLLGRGLENESFRMEELGFVGCKEEMEIELNCLESGKDEEGKEQQQQQKHEFDCEIDMAKDAPFELSFEYDSATCGEEEEKVDGEAKNNNGESEKKSKEKNQKKKKKKIELNLDYDAVISAWAAQACPWTDGNRPEIDLEEECWPDWIMGNWGGEVGEQGYGGVGGQYQAMARGGREARVCRYREKRRTRLFSKKIRYEVRKLNAEKRPRMKGRFVKRATFAAAAALHSK